MSYYDEEDFYEPSEFDEKINELKDYLKNSVKQEIQEQIQTLETQNQNLQKENRDLKSKNKSIENENIDLLNRDNVLKILADTITKDNVYKIIEAIFPKTFDENTHECSEIWGAYVNYYDNRKDVISLLKYVNIEVPQELETVILPHEWSEDLLDKFFNTMHRHVNCNGNTYERNLKYFSYKTAANPFPAKIYSSYDEIPWQFVLRNPLLNSKKYALKIVDAMNEGYNGLKFAKICSYQDLDEEILQIILDKIVLKEKTDKSIFDFLMDHIELISDKEKLDLLYPEVEARWRCYDTVLKMPQEYQIKYAKSIDDAERKIEFLNETSLSKEEKTQIIIGIFA